MSQKAPRPSHTDKDYRSPWAGLQGSGSLMEVEEHFDHRAISDFPGLADVFVWWGWGDCGCDSCIVPSPEAAMVSNPEAVKSTNSNAAISA